MNKRQKESLIWSLVGLFILLCIGVVVYFIINGFGFNSYINQNAGFKISYPKNWEVRENPEEGALVAFVSPSDGELDIFRENLAIMLQDISSNPMTFNKYTQLAINQLTSAGQIINVISSNPILVGGKDGHEFIYQIKTQQLDIQLLHVWVMEGNRVFQMNFASTAAQFDLYKDTVHKIINSFRLIKHD